MAGSPKRLCSRPGKMKRVCVHSRPYFTVACPTVQRGVPSGPCSCLVVGCESVRPSCVLAYIDEMKVTSAPVCTLN